MFRPREQYLSDPLGLRTEARTPGSAGIFSNHPEPLHPGRSVSQGRAAKARHNLRRTPSRIAAFPAGAGSDAGLAVECSLMPDIDKRVVTSPEFPRPLGPYSHAVVSGGFVFVAGQAPINPAT